MSTEKEKALELAIHDFDACMKTGVPFVSLCHVGPVQEGDEGLGFELYRRLIRHSGEYPKTINKLTLAKLSEVF